MDRITSRWRLILLEIAVLGVFAVGAHLVVESLPY